MKIRDIINIINESIEKTYILYHGTCEDNAKSLIQNGWQPNSGNRGGNMGQTRYLYLTSGTEDALWFAQEKGCNTIVEVSNIPESYLIVDPEDGVADNVHDEINNQFNLPGKVALTKSLDKSHFRIIK